MLRLISSYLTSEWFLHVSGIHLGLLALFLVSDNLISALVPCHCSISFSCEIQPFPGLSHICVHVHWCCRCRVQVVVGGKYLRTPDIGVDDRSNLCFFSTLDFQGCLYIVVRSLTAKTRNNVITEFFSGNRATHCHLRLNE